jgi:hypothetical protein
MFRPNWPSSGVQVVVVKDSAAHCNAVFFPPTVVPSGCFGYVGCRWLLLVLFSLLVLAALSVLAGAGVLLLVDCEADQHTTELPPCSHNQQTKQNQKQPRATHIAETTRGNYKETALQ